MTAMQPDMQRSGTRLLATVLLLGGLLLLVLSQVAYRAVIVPRNRWLLLLSLLGALLFLLGGQLALRGRPPQRLSAFMARLAGYLEITAGQLALLALAPLFGLLAALAAGRNLLAYHATVALTGWLLSIGCAVAGSLRVDEPRLRFDRREMAVTAALFAVALVLRASLTAVIPTTFSGDEGSAGLFAVMFLSGETDNVLGLGWFSFPAFSFLLQSAGIAVFGQTIEALRIVSAVGGALTVVAVYWLGRLLFGRLTGFAAAVVLTASHYHIHMSRIGLNNIWDGLFGTLAMAALWDGWRSGRRVSFVLCGLALGFGQYFYVSMRLLPVLYLIWGGYAWWRQRAQFRDRFSGLLLAGFVALIVFLPLGLLFVEHPDEFNAPLERVSIFSEYIGTNGRPVAQFALEQLVLGALAFTHEPLRLLYNPGAPLLLPAAAALFIVGLLWLLWQFDLRTLLLVLPLLAAVASGMFSQGTPASQRYVMTMPIAAVMVALPLVQVTQWLQQLWPRYRRLVLAGLLVALTGLALVDLRYYFVDVTGGSYVLGGNNTAAADAIASYLQAQDGAVKRVYFFGFPRMGYYSLSTIPYLVPDVEGLDVAESPTAVSDWAVDEQTLFIFLPERVGELAPIQALYPGGTYQELPPGGPVLFMVFDPYPQP